jgi:hypothetical protein
MPVNVVRVADRVAGTAIERLTSAHHARRLGKLGRSAQRTPPEDRRLWAAGDPPPRAGNALEVLIDGAAYFPALEQAIRTARRSVLIAGWCNTPGFALVRDEPPVLLRELLGGDLQEHFPLLLRRQLPPMAPIAVLHHLVLLVQGPGSLPGLA